MEPAVLVEVVALVAGMKGRDTPRAVSRENVEIVRSIYEAVNRRDWDAAFRDQDPNIELTTPPAHGQHSGRASH